MPADNSLSMEPSAKHGDGDAPYPCHAWAEMPRPAWGIEYGYCRTSLDYHPEGYKQGSDDPRCPLDCPHKASTEMAKEFGVIFMKGGAVQAAAWAKGKLDDAKTEAAKAGTGVQT